MLSTDFASQWTHACHLTYSVERLASEEVAAQRVVESLLQSTQTRSEVHLDEVCRALAHSVTLLGEVKLLVEGELLQLGPDLTKRVVDGLLQCRSAARSASTLRADIGNMEKSHMDAIRTYSSVVTQRANVIKEREAMQQQSMDGLLKQLAHYEALYEWIRCRTISTMRERVAWLETYGAEVRKNLSESSSFAQECGELVTKIESVLPRHVVVRVPIDSAQSVADRFIARVEAAHVIHNPNVRHIGSREEMMLLRELLEVSSTALSHESVTRAMNEIRVADLLKKSRLRDITDTAKLKMLPLITTLREGLQKVRDYVASHTRRSLWDLREVTRHVFDLHNMIVKQSLALGSNTEIPTRRRMSVRRPSRNNSLSLTPIPVSLQPSGSPSSKSSNEVFDVPLMKVLRATTASASAVQEALAGKNIMTSPRRDSMSVAGSTVRRVSFASAARSSLSASPTSPTRNHVQGETTGHGAEGSSQGAIQTETIGEGVLPPVNTPQKDAVRETGPPGPLLTRQDLAAETAAFPPLALRDASHFIEQTRALRTSNESLVTSIQARIDAMNAITSSIEKAVDHITVEEGGAKVNTERHGSASTTSHDGVVSMSSTMLSMRSLVPTAPGTPNRSASSLPREGSQVVASPTTHRSNLTRGGRSQQRPSTVDHGVLPRQTTASPLKYTHAKTHYAQKEFTAWVQTSLSNE